MSSPQPTRHEVAIGLSRVEANVIIEALEMAEQIWRTRPHTQLKRGVLTEVTEILKQ